MLRDDVACHIVDGFDGELKKALCAAVFLRIAQEFLLQGVGSGPEWRDIPRASESVCEGLQV